MGALDPFHPAISTWFRQTLGTPTEVQESAWPRIAAGEHVLATAPTGSGKTLTAFLWALQQLLTSAWPGGATRVLYVSPMRALNNDVQRNLLGPLEALSSRIPGAPPVRVLTRSGDTPQDERARMGRRPPEILVTTPESLAILLTSRGGRSVLRDVRATIVDEVHAIAGGKRGAMLMTSLERLAVLAGEFQRVALTATVRPLETIAAWIGGEGRHVAIVASRTPKAYDIAVRFPAAESPAGEPAGGMTGGAPGGPPSPAPGAVPAGGDALEALWPAVTTTLRAPLAAGRKTLVFANSRQMVEKLARLVNERHDEGPRGELVWAHHGSLSREVRRVVEERLKGGTLAGVIATNSLELGIDIGHIDEVLLVQTPPSVISAVQRIGRAGHGVGETSRGTFLPLYAKDILDAVVAARAVREGAIEPVTPVVAPLDVLAQAIVSTVATESWPVEDLFALLRRAAPFRALPRAHFDLVLAMLSGRYAGTRVRELRPIVAHDEVGRTVTGLPGAARLVYMAGGTIPDRGYYHLKRTDTGAPIGQLDEEFVWERRIGDTFTLGVQSWRIERVTHNDVFVTPAPHRGAMAPFWRADARDRGALLSERIARFVEALEPRLSDARLPARVAAEEDCSRATAVALVEWLRTQREACGGLLPHRHRVVVEYARDPGTKDPAGTAALRDAPSAERGPTTWTIVHTLWGGRVNRPFSLALAAAHARRAGTRIDVLHDDTCVVLGSTGPVDLDALLAAVRSDTVDDLVRDGLAATGFFGAHFREAAGIALLLPRQGFNRRTPLWLSRQKAKDLLDAVKDRDDFPVVLEAWRACLSDALDLPVLRARLDELHDGTIARAECFTARPSPFAGNVVWTRTNELMYEDDTPPAGAHVRPDLLREVTLAPHLRPRIASDLAAMLRRKLQRTFPGYAPRTADELYAFTLERVAIPRAEWDELKEAIRRDHDLDPDALIASLPGRFGERAGCVVATPVLARFAALENDTATLRPVGVDDDADPCAELVAEWLAFYPPLPAASIAATLGLDAQRVASCLADLDDEERIVRGALTDTGTGTDTGPRGPETGDEVCDAENLERLLRLARRAARPSFVARPLAELGPFLAAWQGAVAPSPGNASPGAGDVEGALRRALERLFGFGAAAELWETEILAARVPSYRGDALDALLSGTDLRWFGCGDERIAFALEPDRELFTAPPRDEDGAKAGEPREARDDRPRVADALVPPAGRHVFEDLAARAGAGASSADIARRLWSEAWSGTVTADSFAPVRRGVETGFAPSVPERPSLPGRRGHRAAFARWSATRPFGGAWFRLAPPFAAADALEEDERARDRARVLLDRYGVVFRELCARELPALSFGGVFRALRLMELSGEVVAGQFFDGVPGLQFAVPDALRVLEAGVPADRIAWLNATDPASPAGLALPPAAGDPPLPRRVDGAHLAWIGARLAVVSERQGARLTIHVPPDDPALPAALGFLHDALTRSVRPRRAITVETINDAPATDSPYRTVLAAIADVERDVASVRLTRTHRTRVSASPPRHPVGKLTRCFAARIRARIPSREVSEKNRDTNPVTPAPRSGARAHDRWLPQALPATRRRDHEEGTRNARRDGGAHPGRGGTPGRSEARGEQAGHEPDRAQQARGKQDRRQQARREQAHRQQAPVQQARRQ